MGLFGDRIGPDIEFLHGTSDLVSYYGFICSEGITADQLVGVAIEPQEDIIRTVYANHRLDGATKGMIAYESSPEVISCLPVSYLTLFETTKPVPQRRKYLIRLAGVLNQVRCRAGRKENELYCAGQTKALTCQYAVISNKRYVTLNDPSDPGIASVRYDEPRRRFIGIRSDHRGLGVSLASMDREVALRHPDKMHDPMIWTDILEAPNLPLLSLSRPFCLHKGGQFVLHDVVDGRFIIGFDADGKATVLRTFIHPAFIIGAPGLQRPSTVVTYRPTPRGTEVQVVAAPPASASPLSQLIL